MRFQFHWNPVTAKRWRRFRKMRRAWWSLWLLLGMYGVSLLADVLCNNTPVVVRYEGRTHVPLLHYVPEAAFLHNGRQTRPDYKALAASPTFRPGSGNWIVFPPIPFGPHEILDPATIPVPREVTLRFQPEPRTATINVRPDLTVARATDAAFFLESAEPQSLSNAWLISAELRKAVAQRFNNEPTPSFRQIQKRPGGPAPRQAEISLSAFTPRQAPPATVRITIRETTESAGGEGAARFDAALKPLGKPSACWGEADESTRSNLLAMAAAARTGVAEPRAAIIHGRSFTVRATRPEVSWPFPPCPSHWLGIDDAGRDVLVRLVYGLRTSLTFGLLLAILSMALGIVAGAVQGYYAGRVDLAGQRFTEIWSAIPFLYVMILLGSVYGRGFILLLIIYAIFNWIGISYYIRAEFYRLRHLPFVEAACTTGLTDRLIMFRHILPNALVPVITFFPFNLVGAIGSLAALDYLGFGLPPPTPSWGEMLQQAEQFRWAWWLILYPFLALFIVMMLAVFVGEGVRNAYDPRPESRIE